MYVFGSSGNLQTFICNCLSALFSEGCQYSLKSKGNSHKGLLYSGPLPSPALCSLMRSSHVPLLQPSYSAPPAKATSNSVFWQPFKGMDLDEAYQEDSIVANLLAADA
jgi:hypothetical protein